MHALETMITDAASTLFSNSPPPPLMQDIDRPRSRRARCSSIWATHGVDTEVLNEQYFKAARGAQDAVGDPGRQARRRARGAAGGVRAARVGFFDRALLDGQ